MAREGADAADRYLFMEALTSGGRLLCRFATLLLVLPWSAAHSTPRGVDMAGDSGLYGRSVTQLLDRHFPSPQVEYLLLDSKTMTTTARRWDEPESAIPAGSLFKPFVALAFAAIHGNQPKAFPVVDCHGSTDRCWRSGGHGPLTLERALAYSCNAYFLALAGEVARSENGLSQLKLVNSVYGLPGPPSTMPQPAELIGLTSQWQVKPAELARAYALLSQQPGNPTLARLVEGLRLAASPGGTAARIGVHPGGVLAKTGTAPCVEYPARQHKRVHRCVANGDGLVVLMAPAQSPRWVLLVRQRGTNGANAAEVAGRMLTLLEDPHAAQ
jgi:cell division protein FtsI/penicillin-binding protein 2